MKVFRTYNASVVLDRLLAEVEEAGTLGGTVDTKKASYDKANKEVGAPSNCRMPYSYHVGVIRLAPLSP